jgi:uncharacterized protein (DUF1778 family)
MKMHKENFLILPRVDAGISDLRLKQCRARVQPAEFRGLPDHWTSHLRKCRLLYRRKDIMPTQISAEISESTRELLEKYARNSGIKKGFLIEQAVLDYIRALEQLPVDVLLPVKIVLTRNSASKVVHHLKRPPRPTRRLRQLMTNDH